MENTKKTATNKADTPINKQDSSAAAELALLQSKYQSLEASYKLKCEECNKISEAYKTSILKYRGMVTAIRTYTKAYNLSLELLLPIGEGEQ